MTKIANDTLCLVDSLHCKLVLFQMLTNSTFAGLNNLEGLNLANNDLLDIRADNFHMLKLLTRLDLSHNFIKVIFTSTNMAATLKMKGRQGDSFDFTGCTRSLPLYLWNKCLWFLCWAFSLKLPPDKWRRTSWQMVAYCQTSNISCTPVGIKIADHSDVVGASPVAAASTISSFRLKAWLQLIGQRQLQDETIIVYVLGFGASYIRYLSIVLVSWSKPLSKPMSTHIAYRWLSARLQ